jgi:hypothetical protein
MTTTLPSDEIDAAARNDATRLYGWVLFSTCGVFCAITSGLLYWWNVEFNVSDVRLWIAALFCAPPYLLSCIGFIQAVSAVPCTRLRKTWPTLKLSQRVLIVSFGIGAVCLAILYIYFLVSLTTTPQINSGAL